MDPSSQFLPRRSSLSCVTTYRRQGKRGAILKKKIERENENEEKSMTSSVLPSQRPGLALVRPSIFKHWLRIAAFGPFFFVASLLRLPFWLRSWLNRPRLAANYVNEAQLDSEEEFTKILHRIGDAGQRSTGSKAHADLVDWFEAELQKVPGLELRSEKIELLGWETNGSLHDAGRLMVGNLQDDSDLEPVSIAGVIPYALPTAGQSGRLLYVPPQKQLSWLTPDDLRGKIILRDFPLRRIPYALATLPAYYQTPDLAADLGGTLERPGFADQPIHEDLLEAGRLGAAGVIFAFHIEREQVESYWEPHKGCHYALPAVYVGAKEAAILKQREEMGCRAFLSVDAKAVPLVTRNLIATLPGRSDERVVYITHTDGNTFVQENGGVALLALARYFAKLPLTSRRRTLEFSFNAGHLHISREGSLLQAQQMSAGFDTNNIALAIPVEHLGTREIEAVDNLEGGIDNGRQLQYTGRGELMFWCTGPSMAVVHAVREAIVRRRLDRVLSTRGISFPNMRSVPMFTSFGGIGTYYHNLLVPTTSLISGPWSLWAPSFGIEAVDVQRLRQQTLAIGDIYMAIDLLPKKDVVGGYAKYREQASTTSTMVVTETPPEQASPSDNARVQTAGAVQY